MIESGTISSKVAKDILVEVLQNNKEPAQLVKELGLEQVSDNNELEKIVDFSVEENQIDAKNKDIYYIQNYIFISKKV